MLPISVSSVASTSDSSLNMALTFSLSDLVDPDRSMVLTTLCWCSTVHFVWCYPWFFQYLIWDVTAALLMDGCLHEVDCLTCSGITDLISLITLTQYNIMFRLIHNWYLKVIADALLYCH